MTQNKLRPCAITCRVAAHLFKFRRDQMGCTGVIMVNADRILLDSNVAKETDYRLYLNPKYVETGP